MNLTLELALELFNKVSLYQKNKSLTPKTQHPAPFKPFSMYIYNVTTNIDESIHEQWLSWMQKTHIPAMMATGKFTHAKMCKVLVEEEMGGFTYSVQYATASKETLQKYYKEDAPQLRQESLKLFADKILAFRTELEIISEH